MADGENLKLETHAGARPGQQVIVLQGVLNAETAFQFRDCVRNKAPDTLILDMTGLRYVDSSGVGAIIGAYVSFERNYRRLLLAGINDRIWHVFRTCRIDDVFTRYATVADAEQTIPAPA